MFKKAILLSLPIFLFVALFVPHIFAEETVREESSPSAKKQTVDYNLPYPGILPDNPFYIVKTLRDGIIRFFISDPLKKAEFDLLQADKRLNAGYYLFIKGDKSQKLALSTISKGENYFFNAIEGALKAEKQGIETDALWEKLLTSSKKHKEILEDLRLRSSKNLTTDIENELKRVSDFGKKVEKIKLK